MVGLILHMYIFYQGNFVGDLDLKVSIGWNLLYCVLAIIVFHAISGTIVIWLLLKDLETALPEEDDPSKGLQKQVDLFRLKPKKEDKLHDVLEQGINDDIAKDEANKDADNKIMVILFCD